MSEETLMKGEAEFEAAVEKLIKVTPKSKPFLIFKKIENKPTEARPDAVPLVVPFLFPLDTSAATVAQVTAYELKGWKIVYSNMPDSALKGRPEAIGILNHLRSHEQYSNSVPAEVETEGGDVVAKLARKNSKKEKLEE
jgi:hypothetical protein